MTDADLKYMQRCLDLASNGLGYVAPNPMVGSVLVHGETVIGEGYHRNWGGKHAEANAIESVVDKSLLSESTLYVNLEPCSHHGKTPPCVDLIISYGIKRVVVACVDPYHKVSGRGIQTLRDHGCNVHVGLLNKEATLLNRRFMVYHQKRRPYIVLKWAQTVDGFIDIIRHKDSEARPTWITSEKLRALVHKWRSEEAAIMVGTNTARLDNPHLNLRSWYGKPPVRVVIDRNGSLSPTLSLFDGQQQTLVFNRIREEQHRNVSYIRISSVDDDNLHDVLHRLHQMGIQSILVEGGRSLLQSFIDQHLWDEARVLVGPQFFGSGCRAPLIGDRTPQQVILGKETFFWFQQ